MLPPVDISISTRLQPVRKPAAPGLFFRRWIANPLQMGSITPSSPALCRRVVAQSNWANESAVVELGAGTGVISRALLDAGLPPERLFVVEIEQAMAAHLAHILPGAHVLHGDAALLPELVPASWHGRIGTVICGIPLILLPYATQQRLVTAMTVVAPGRGFLHFSYMLGSPIDAPRLGLEGRRVAWTPLNLPPASVWRYLPKAAPATA